MPSRSNRRAQSAKERTERVLDLRRGSRTDPIPSGTEYDRNDWRRKRQSRRYDEDD